MDQLAEKVAQLGRGTKVFKINLSCAYRQIFLCPAAINWLGYMFKGKYYFDCTLSMGSRSSAHCCQRVTSAVVYIFKTKFGYFAINYLDDLGGAETPEKAEAAFNKLREILVKMGLQEACDKTVPPCTVMVFLGIQVNTIDMTLTIPKDKWQEISKELTIWLRKETATLKETQRLAGLLNFTCHCVRSGQVYLSRILNFLHMLPKFGNRRITKQVKKDVQWWVEFAQSFNGVALIPDNDWAEPDHVFSSDCCLTGGGGFSEGEFYHWKYNSVLVNKKFNVNQLECLNVVMCLKLWGSKCRGKKLLLMCDNYNTMCAINSGSSRDKVVQCCLREVHKITAWHSIQIRMRFLKGVDNRISDSLSRWHLDKKFTTQFYELTRGKEVREVGITENLWNFVL